MKRIIALLLTLVMLLGILPAAALAANFTDVQPGAYYEDAVNWAVANNITSGTGGNKFSPDAICSRGQIVTFLWRATGCPAPTNTTCTFTDVVAGSYYYDAMLWAVEKNITTGTGGNKFSPDMACSRGQVVTFLWRAAGCPAPTNTTCDFTDAVAGSYYYDAMLWAVENNITTGTGGNKFSPNAPCTRAQVVTFLYRAKDLLGRLTITTQPKDIACEGGDTVQFSVEVTGGKAPYRYQWQFKAASDIDYADLSTDDAGWADGWNTETLDVEVYNSDFDHRYSYRCIITDAAGDEVISDGAEAYETLKITTQPVDVYCVAGNTVQLSVEVDGGLGELNYHWTRKSGSGTFQSIRDGIHSGMLHPTMTITVYDIIFESDYVYRCTITDEAGNEVISDEVRLIKASPVTIVTQPQNVNVEDGDTAEFSVAATGGVAPYTYQWQESYDGVTYTDLGPTYGCQGYNTPELSILVQPSIYGCKYRCVITDKAGQPVTSDAAGIYRPFSFTTYPTNKTAYTGDTATFTVAAQGAEPLTYQWQVKLPGFRNYMNVNSTIALTGSTAATLTVNVSDVNMSGAQFRCKVTDADGAVYYSNAARLTAKSKLVITGSEKVESDNLYTLRVEASGGSGDYTYTWYKKRYQRGESADSVSFIPTGDSTSTVSVTASSNYTIEYKCIVSDGEQSDQVIFSIYG